MKFAIIFLLLSSILTQDGFKEFFNNFVQEKQTNKVDNRNLSSAENAKNFINNKLPNGMKFSIDENNIDHYLKIQTQFHDRLSMIGEYSKGFEIMMETSLELDNKISTYFKNEQKKQLLKILLPNEKDKTFFIKFFQRIRKEYKECLLQIRSNLFNSVSIENCLGKDLSKVNNSMDFQFRQYQARKETSLRQLFLRFCYQIEDASAEDCDVIEKDMIDLLWENYSLANNFRNNRTKYEGLSSHISQEIYEHLLSIFVDFSALNENMTIFIKEIYDGFKLKLKEDIQNQERIILEYEAPQKVTKPSAYINTKVDIKQTYQGDDNYVSIDKLPSVQMNKDPKLFSRHDNKALQDLKSEYPNYDEDNYPFKGLKGPKVTIPEQIILSDKQYQINCIKKFKNQVKIFRQQFKKTQMKILVFIFITLPTLQEQLIQCKKEIPESYGLGSYLRPRRNELYLCPTLESSCCSPYDQFKMYNKWNKQIKPKLENHFDQLAHNLRTIEEQLESVFELNFQKIIKKMNATQDAKNKLFETYLGIKNENLVKLIQQILVIQEDTFDFLLKVRRGFQCSICDFNNHQYLVTETQEVILSEHTCAYLSENTINYSFLVNHKLYHWLQELSELLTNFGGNETTKQIKVKNYILIDKATQNCATIYKGGLKPTSFRKCYDFCRSFKFNAMSPVIEGNLGFLQSINIQITKFLQNFGSEKEDRVRVLEESEKDNRVRVLEESAQNPADFELKFNKNVLENAEDIYEEKATNPNLDDYIINQMFKTHKEYQDNKLLGYKNFVKNKLHHIDAEYDYENADENDVFQTTNHTLITLEIYHTIIETQGINIENVTKKNFMEENLVDLISHIKQNSPHQITYEKLDDKLVHELNEMNNDYLAEFHRDHYMNFRDYSLQMKHDEVHSQLDKFTELGIKAGYNLGHVPKLQQIIIMSRFQKNVSWIFISSEAPESDAIQPPIEKMVKKEHIKDRPTVIGMDLRRVRATFKRKYNHFVDQSYEKIKGTSSRAVLTKIAKTFNRKCDGTMIYYSGITFKNGDFCILYDSSHIARRISFNDIIRCWKKHRNPAQKHLLLILDGNHTGHWARKLMLANISSISIQTSCAYWQRAVVEEKLGSFFTHNLLKIVNKRKGELIQEPYLNAQTPRFCGRFLRVKKIFGLQLKYESWPDMRKALGATKYGSWPRIGDGGIIILPDGTRYEGDIVQGKKEGMGAIYSPNGIKLYEGQFKNDKMHGLGILFYTNGYKAYEGEFFEGKKHGHGTEFTRDGVLACQGMYKNNVKHGPIVEFYKNGKVKFKGIYKNNFRNGYGEEFYESGQVRARGNWVGELMEGQGEIFWENGNLRYSGMFRNGLLNGKGKEYWDNGQLKYDGDWVDGIYNGNGKLYNRQGNLICEGIFVDGLLHGLGRTFYINGNVMYEGEFERGKAVGIGYLNKQEGVEEYKGQDELVIREAMLAGVYDKRRNMKKFESKTHFETPVDFKDYDKIDFEPQNLNAQKGKGRVDVSKDYRKRRVNEIHGTLISGFTSTPKQIHDHKYLPGIYMNQNTGYDERRSVFLNRSQIILNKSQNNPNFSTMKKDRSFQIDKRSKSFRLPKQEQRRTSFKQQLKKLKDDQINLNQLIRRNSINSNGSKNKKKKKKNNHFNIKEELQKDDALQKQKDRLNRSRRSSKNKNTGRLPSNSYNMKKKKVPLYYSQANNNKPNKEDLFESTNTEKQPQDDYKINVVKPAPDFYSNTQPTNQQFQSVPVQQTQQQRREIPQDEQKSSKRQLFNPLSLITKKASKQNFQSIKDLLA